MQIITSKTHHAIRSDFSRRGFLKLIRSAAVGVVVYSEFGIARVCLGQGFGWAGLLKYFGQFALDFGMAYLGTTAQQYLSRHPAVHSAFKSFTSELNEDQYTPYYNWQQIAGYESTFFPIQSSKNFMLPFFNTDNGQLASPMKWFTGLTMPLVNTALHREQGWDNESIADYLLPREPQGDTANDVSLPEDYVTNNGSVGYDFRGDENSGEVHWTVYAKDESSDIHKPFQRGTSVVALNRA